MNSPIITIEEMHNYFTIFEAGRQALEIDDEKIALSRVERLRNLTTEHAGLLSGIMDIQDPYGMAEQVLYELAHEDEEPGSIGELYRPNPVWLARLEHRQRKLDQAIVWLRLLKIESEFI